MSRSVPEGAAEALAAVRVVELAAGAEEPVAELAVVRVAALEAAVAAAVRVAEPEAPVELEALVAAPEVRAARVELEEPAARAAEAGVAEQREEELAERVAAITTIRTAIR